MFVYIALISSFWTALQNTLMAKYARMWDSLSASFYRSVALIFSVSPLLFFVNYEKINLDFENLKPVIFAGIITSFSFWLFMQSFKYLPVSISSAIRYALNVIIVNLIWLFYFSEILSFWNIIFIIILLIWWIILSIFKTDFEHLNTKNFFKWIILVIISWIFWGIAFSFLADWARKLDPYLAWYLWEMIILISFFIIILIRKLFIWKWFEKINFEKFKMIFLASSPTLLATWGFTLATTLWQVWLVSAITVSGLLITAILWKIIYKENLKLIQYFWIFLIFIAIIWIKIV